MVVWGHRCRVFRDGSYEYSPGTPCASDCVGRVKAHKPKTGGFSRVTSVNNSVLVIPADSVRARTRSGWTGPIGPTTQAAPANGRHPFLLDMCGDAEARAATFVAPLTEDEQARVDEFVDTARELLLDPDHPELDGMVSNAFRAVSSEAAVLELYTRRAAHGAAGGAEVAEHRKYVHKRSETVPAELGSVYTAYYATEMAANMAEGAWTALGASLLLLGGHAAVQTRDVICRFMCGVVCDDYAHEAGRALAEEGPRRLAEAHDRKEAVIETLRATGELWSHRLILNGHMVATRAKLTRPMDATLVDYATALVHMRANLPFDELVCARVADFGTDAYMEINPDGPWCGPAGYFDDISLCGCMAHDIVDMATDEREMEVLNIAAHAEVTRPGVSDGLSGRFVSDVLVAAPTVAVAGNYGTDDAMRVPYGVVAWMFGTGRYRAWERVTKVDGLAPPPRATSPLFMTALHAACAEVITATMSTMPYSDAVVSLLTLGRTTPEKTEGITGWRQAVRILLEAAVEVESVTECSTAANHAGKLATLVSGHGDPSQLAATTQAMLGAVMAADVAGVDVKDAYRALCIPLVAAYVLGGICDTTDAGKRLHEGIDRVEPRGLRGAGSWRRR